MSGHPVPEVNCAHEGCENTHKKHKWGYIKAGDWMHQKDGTSWCPEHLPDWVKSWREEGKRLKEKYE